MHKRAASHLVEEADSVARDAAGAGSSCTPLPPWLAEIEERIRKAPSLWDTLSEEDWEFFRNYDGPEVLGPPPPPPMRRRPRRRGET